MPHGLSRACDRATAERPAGAPLFWTLGANQSGKAAIAAWRDMLLPTLASDADSIRLWPFAGAFRALLAPGKVTLAETYPAEALRHLGIGLEWQQKAPGRPGGGGGSPARGDGGAGGAARSRRSNSQSLPASDRDAAGEDRFDCILGVLCVLNVLAGNRPDTAPADTWVRRWEGWVLGQTALPRDWPCLGASHRTKMKDGDKKNWRAPEDAPKVVLGNAIICS